VGDAFTAARWFGASRGDGSARQREFGRSRSRAAVVPVGAAIGDGIRRVSEFVRDREALGIVRVTDVDDVTV